MTKRGKIIENVTVGSYAAEAKCVARVDGQVIFIENTAPEDVVDILITRKKKSFLEARPLKFHKLSPFRADPFCSHYGECGGCKWQHLLYDKQLEFKQQQIKEQLERIGGLTDLVYHPILGSDEITEYRNKLEYTFSSSRWLTTEEIESGKKINRNGLGFHKPRMFDKVIDIDKCYLQPDLSNKIRNYVREIVLENNIPFYDLREHVGFLRNLIVRNSNTGEWMVILQVKHEQDDWVRLILDSLGKQFKEITSLYYIVNEKLNESYADQEPVLFKGKAFLTEKMEGLEFQIGPKSFFQTNSKQSYRLYSVARKMAELTGQEVVYDLYTGTGTIANFIAAEAKKVIGIEYIEESIQDAVKNAGRNNIANTGFFAGDMKDVLNDEFIQANGKPDIIITDPPRAGMHKDVVEKLLKISAEKIVYISCNPATQARDIGILSEKYNAIESQGIDMFPHTQHIENIVLLKRK